MKIAYQLYFSDYFHDNARTCYILEEVKNFEDLWEDKEFFDKAQMYLGNLKELTSYQINYDSIVIQYKNGYDADCFATFGTVEVYLV